MDHCNTSDFEIVSREGTRLKTCRCALLKSDVFEGMLHCCDATAEQAQVLELDESAEDLQILFEILEKPLEPPVPCLPKTIEAVQYLSAPEYYPHTLIPMPILLKLLTMVDKYAIDSLYPTLCAHLEAHLGTFPLLVYGYASSHDMTELAINASKYLLHPPLSTYDAKDVALVPHHAYQQLVELHALRVRLLRELMAQENLFPFDYGICTRRGHAKRMRDLWSQLRDELADRVEAGSDVATEMEAIYEEAISCQTCHKGCVAAVEMLRYKCRRLLPTRIDELPQASTD